MLLKKNNDVDGKEILSSELIISNDVVSLTRQVEGGKQIEETGDARKVADLYFGTATTSTGILPPVVKYINPDLTAFILERPPEFNRVSYAGETYDIVMPWLLYCVRFEYNSNDTVDHTGYKLIDVKDVHLFARNTQAFGMGDKLMRAPLPWVGKDGSVSFWARKIPTYKRISLGDALGKIKLDVFTAKSEGDAEDYEERHNISLTEYFEQYEKQEIEDVVEKQYEQVMFNDTTPLKMGHIVQRFAASGIDKIKTALDDDGRPDYDVFDYFDFLIKETQ